MPRIFQIELLTSLQHYRRRDPIDTDETEFMENIFDSLCSALVEAEIKKLFLKSEGVDLMVLTMMYALLPFSSGLFVIVFASGTKCKRVLVLSRHWTTQLPDMQGQTRAQFSSRHRA